jgi:prepilin signal peptidase PulO-like enzyme (type II secretory pathway)
MTSFSGTISQALPFIALAVTVVASIIDLRTRKIPNFLTFPAAALGIILSFFVATNTGLMAILGWIVGAGIMIAFNLFGNKKKMGFGDAKLIAAVGAFLGLKVCIAWGYFAVLYGLVAAFKFVTAIPWRYFGDLLKGATIGVAAPLDTEAVQKLNTVMNEPIPLAPLIALGTLASILLDKPTLQFLGLPG